MKKIKNNHYIRLFIVIFALLLAFITYKYKQNKKNDIYIPVLMYHNIEPNPEFKKITYTIKPELFESHMKALKEKGYNTITVTELNDFIKNKKELPKKPILITLDDGKTNNYEYAYPVLKKLNMKGNMFVITHTAEEHKNEQYLDWNRLKEMYDSGVMDIQGHTYNLHHKIDNDPVIFNKLYRESEDEYKERILNDFKLSKQLIEDNIGNKVISLAYPYGEYDDEIEEIAKQAGYQQTYSTDTGIMSKKDSPYLVKRINIDGLCSTRRLIFEIEALKILKSIFH
ncbi:polysaccharide deacetylase [Gottschalkia acidurici 9a]|uniref:Polysaccharide deacetylase n=1 Tax=Gottschalkia acidurici (strain ATCC 7906 / DSM 604 / BCRC 14475 / CIP 104303 / KCTC 5404 / NCIMB 10678 / 9a) TaxID=1128398 RepID=K0AZQ0_GOTA9|nr:polysaccharide deacetylase family protein [Gottschalkia acidurici]AFS78754.1 polysaccharide deacetylase [Gottschalkia acidurici 9a]